MLLLDWAFYLSICVQTCHTMCDHANLQKWHLWCAAPWGKLTTIHCREYLQPWEYCCYSCFPFKFVHYVSRYCNYYNSTTNGCVLWCFIYNYNCYACPQLGTKQQLWVRRCGSAFTADPKGLEVLFAMPQQLTQSQMPFFQAYANFAMGPPQVDSFRADPSTNLCIYISLL